MRRIINIAKRDFKSTVRDFIAIYNMVAPIILSFIIVAFVSSAASATITLAVAVDFSNVGTTYSPIAKIGLISMPILSLVLGGMVVSMNIIEEKESLTFAALNASPLTRFEFIVGKSLIGSMISVIQIVLIYFILGLVSPSQMPAIAKYETVIVTSV